MIKSMTGFGKVSLEIADKKLTIEIKTLNSKQFDFNCRLPYIYRSYELEFRSWVMEALERGKIDLSISIEKGADKQAAILNSEVILSYCEQLQEIENTLKRPTDNLLGIAITLPESFSYAAKELTEEEIVSLQDLTKQTLEKVDEFRIHEGAVLEADFRRRVKAIEQMLGEVDVYDQERIPQIKERITRSLSKMQSPEGVDANRFEQELIYYVEKLDITEEKVRLKKHLDYFIEVLNSPISQGRKLGFVLQEIGREINTIGSKANHAEMQKTVVQMKDELEKMKEQLSNIL